MTFLSLNISSKGIRVSEQSSLDLGFEIAIFLATQESWGSISNAAKILHACGDLL